MGWETTLATVVVEVAGAIDELLLGKRVEGAVVDEGVSLEGSHGGEGPARAARSLVLDRGDTILGSPVPGVWDVSDTLVEGIVLGG